MCRHLFAEAEIPSQICKRQSLYGLVGNGQDGTPEAEQQRPWRLPDRSVRWIASACVFCAADVGHRTSTHFFLSHSEAEQRVKCQSGEMYLSRTSRSHSPTGTPTGSIFCFSCIVCAFTLSRSQHSQWKQLEQAGEVTLWIFQDLSSTYCPIDKSISYWIWVHRMSRAKQNPFWQYRLIIYDNIDCSFPSCFASTALRYHMQLWVERLSMSRPREIWFLWWKHGRLDCSSWRFLFTNSMTIWTTGIHTVWPHGLNRSDLSDLSDFRLEMTGTPLAACHLASSCSVLRRKEAPQLHSALLMATPNHLLRPMRDNEWTKQSASNPKEIQWKSMVAKFEPAVALAFPQRGWTTCLLSFLIRWTDASNVVPFLVFERLKNNDWYWSCDSPNIGFKAPGELSYQVAIPKTHRWILDPSLQSSCRVEIHARPALKYPSEHCFSRDLVILFYNFGILESKCALHSNQDQLNAKVWHMPGKGTCFVMYRCQWLGNIMRQSYFYTNQLWCACFDFLSRLMVFSLTLHLENEQCPPKQ